MTPTARTLAALRKEGYVAGVVERWNAHTKTRSDFLGCIDIIAVREGETLGIQATSVANQTSRMKKLQGHDGAAAWLSAGNRLEVWGWGKYKLRPGMKAVRWRSTIRQVEKGA